MHTHPRTLTQHTLTLSHPHTAHPHTLTQHTHIFTGVYKESTYVHALSFAVIAHSIASACTQGLLKACDCTEGPTQSGTEEKKCETNVEVGLRVAEEFLGYRYHGVGKSLKTDMILHNTIAIKKVSLCVFVFFSESHSLTIFRCIDYLLSLPSQVSN